jgi:hypothetical protein
MLPSDYVVSALADLMWADQEDGTAGMIARGVMVRNRVRAGWHGGDWLKNIEDFNPESFSPPIDGRFVKLGDPYRSKLFVYILGQASAIYEGRDMGSPSVPGPDGKMHGGDMIGGALWSARLDQCSAEFAEKIVRGHNHERVAQVGLRSFFK